MPPCRSERLDFLKAANTNGEVSEWSNEPVSKTGDGESHPWVQIPPSPQSTSNPHLKSGAPPFAKGGVESSNLSLSAKTGVSGNQFFIKVFSVY